jgi:hypothetical protein
MKLWINTKFKGYYPVGVAALIIAETVEEATILLSKALAERGLPPALTEQFEEVPLRSGEVRILCDGNY